MSNFMLYAMWRALASFHLSFLFSHLRPMLSTLLALYPLLFFILR